MLWGFKSAAILHVASRNGRFMGGLMAVWGVWRMRIGEHVNIVQLGAGEHVDGVEELQPYFRALA